MDGLNVQSPAEREFSQNMMNQDKLENGKLIISNDKLDDNEKLEDPNDKYGLKKKIFVGNVGYRISWKQLQEFFSKFGKVSYTHIVKDHLKKRPRGIAFVRFTTEQEADAVLQASDEELMLEGRKLRVHRAEESTRTTFKKYDKIPDLCSETSSNDVEAISKTESQPSASGLGLNDLCDELLLKIISFLTIKERISLERVCHRWRHLSLQAWSCVKSLHFRNMFRRFGGVTDKMLHSLLQRCGKTLVSLDLSASPRLLTDYALDIIAHFCPNLTYIDLSGVKVTNKSLKNLTTSCTKLKVILLQRCLYVGEKGLWWVLHHCKELESVDMEANPGITGKCFHMAGPKLKTLNLSGCSSLCDTGIFKLAELCPLVEELHLQSCLSLTDNAIDRLGKSFAKMTILEATGAFPETSIEGWRALGHSVNLVDLDLSMNIAIGDTALLAISSGCKQLRTLDISSCHRNITDAGVLALAHLPVLENLSISYLHMIHDESLELVAVNGRLRKLTARACGGLTDNGLKTVAGHCSRLIQLDLSGNMQITNGTLTAFVSSVQEFPRRISLHLGGTSVVVENVSIPSCMEVNLMDLSMYHLRSDRDLLLPEPYEEEDEDDGFEDRQDPAANFQPAGEEVGDCPWMEEDGHFGDPCDYFLENDDPINEELWDLG